MENKELQQNVIDFARSLVGIKEVPGNKGWYSKLRPELAEWFEKKMKEVGWKYTQPWCAYTGELVWSVIYDPIDEYQEMIDRLCSGSATKTLNQFEEDGWPTGTVPVPGSLVVWCNMKNGREHWSGHLGVCTSFNDSGFTAVEGNTNAAGSREGDGIYEKDRTYSFTAKKGLRLKGFIYPPGIEPRVPFKNKKEGDKFRNWINDNFPDYAKLIDLDRSGSWFNSFISRAWIDHGQQYSK